MLDVLCDLSAQPRECGARSFESLDEVVELLHTRSLASAHGTAGAVPWVHALQTATLARRAGASDSLITAAWLHDIGHLAAPGGHAGHIAARVEGAGDRHARLGADMLAALFPPNVTEPIRLRAQAQRYLAASRPRDDEGSIVIMAGQRADLRFMTHRHAGDALRLSHWDGLDSEPIGGNAQIQELMRIARRCLRDAKAG